MAAAGAAKALGPADVHQIGPTLRVRPEAHQKRRQITGQVPYQLVRHHALRLVFLFRSYRPDTSRESTVLSVVES
jgi:hypothetical protein